MWKPRLGESWGEREGLVVGEVEGGEGLKKSIERAGERLEKVDHAPSFWRLWLTTL